MSDPRLRHLERLVATGQANPAELVVARLRAGAITVNAIRWAELFSRPIPPPFTQSSYNWHPISWWFEDPFDEAPPNLEALVRECMPRLAQSPTTLQINVMLQSVLDGLRGRVPVIQGFGGRRRLAPVDLPRSVDRWAWRHGFVVSDTGGVDNHPPFEVQWLGEVDGDDPDDRHAERMQAELLAAYVESGPDRRTAALIAQHLERGDALNGQYAWDDVSMWFVRMQAFAGNVEALKLLGWLRYHSTTNYFEVLSPFSMSPFWNMASWAFQTSPQNRGPLAPWQLPEGAPYVPYGEVELDLVRTLLGGPPL